MKGSLIKSFAGLFAAMAIPAALTYEGSGEKSEKKPDRHFSGQLGGTEIRLEMLPQTPAQLIEALTSEHPRTLLLFGDNEHSSIGVRTTEADITALAKLSPNFQEWNSNAQPLYDAFALAIQNQETNSPAIAEFESRVSKNPADYYAPRDPKLRTQYFDETQRRYNHAATNGTVMRLVDASDDDIQNLINGSKASILSNDKLLLNFSFRVFHRLWHSKNLSAPSAIAPVRHEIGVISEFKPEHLDKLNNADRLKLLNVAKTHIDNLCAEHKSQPEKWPAGKIDFDADIDFPSLRTKLEAISAELSKKIEEAEKIRDNHRNTVITSNIVHHLTAGFGTNSFDSGLFIGQGHFSEPQDLDEMLHAALPDVSVIRIDIIPYHQKTIDKLGSCVAKGNYQGSDYIIFTLCPTVQYIEDLKPVKFAAHEPKPVPTLGE